MINRSKMIESYEKQFGSKCDGVVFVPVRLCLLGLHTDHQHGKAIGFPINLGTYVAYGKNYGTISRVVYNNEIYDYNKTKNNIISGTFKEFSKMFPNTYSLNSINLLIEYDYIPGGVGSSSSLILAILRALANVNKIIKFNYPNNQCGYEMVDFVTRVERKYCKLNVGELDPMIQIFGAEDCLTVVDFKTREYKNYHVPYFFSENKFCLLTSMLNDDYKSRYNDNIEKCAMAVRYIKNEFKLTDVKLLGDIDNDILCAASNILYDKVYRKRNTNISVIAHKVIHYFYSEINRVQIIEKLLENNVKINSFLIRNLINIGSEYASSDYDEMNDTVKEILASIHIGATCEIDEIKKGVLSKAPEDFPEIKTDYDFIKLAGIPEHILNGVSVRITGSSYNNILVCAGTSEIASGGCQCAMNMYLEKHDSEHIMNINSSIFSTNGVANE